MTSKLRSQRLTLKQLKSARKFIKRIAPDKVQADLRIAVIDKHQPHNDMLPFITPCLEGISAGIISEAGCPGIADPGADIVAEAHKRGIKVVPLVGPSSILLALMASGFNGQSFAFWGYLPIDKEQRTKRIKDLDLSASRYKQTQIFIETPFRNNQLFEEVLKSCKPNTQICVASNLTAEDEFIKTQSVYNWRKEEIDLHKKPTIFLLY